MIQVSNPNSTPLHRDHASNKLKEQAREIFARSKTIDCPAFPGEKIIFNAKGFSHLFYKGSKKNRTRDRAQIAVRIKLLPRAVKLLKLMPIYQEQASYIFGKRQYKFWAFEGVIDNRRIKAIIRQAGNGHKHFWSVIPGWRRSGRIIRNARSDLRKQ